MKNGMEGDLSGYFDQPTLRNPLSMLFKAQEPKKAPRTPEHESELLSILRRMVGRYYILKGIRMDAHGAYASILLEPDENPDMFEKLRLDLKERNLYPRLLQAEGQWIIAILPSQARKPSKYTVNLIMLAATVFTTVWAGALLWANRYGEMSGLEFITVLLDPASLGFGALTFAFPLLLILGSHEMGHYFTSRAYRVDASLPYFIPVPPLFSPFGTFGALISMKENISNRRALVDIGVAGPIAGFVVAIPVTIIGLFLTDRFPAPFTDMVEGNTYISINPPLLFNTFAMVLGVDSASSIFPTALAGWIGFFVTALNLFPVGQLDGGHIVRGVFGKYAVYISYATVVTMIVLGFVTGFTPYLFFALLILFMGARHPPPLDDVSPLKKRQYIVFGLAILMMALTFHPVPLEIVEYRKGSISVIEHHEHIMVNGTVPTVYTLTVLNTGSMDEDVDLEVFYEGSRLVPSLIFKNPDRLERILSGGERLHAAYELDNITLYLLDPIGRPVMKARTADWRMAALGDPPPEADRGREIEFRFTTEDGLSESISTTLVPLAEGLHLDRTALPLSVGSTVRGKVVVLNSSVDMVNISIRYDQVDPDFRVYLKPQPGNGIWDEPAQNSLTELSPGLDGRVQGIVLSRGNVTGEILEWNFLIDVYYTGGSNQAGLDVVFTPERENATLGSIHLRVGQIGASF